MSQRREDVALALEALDELRLARTLQRQLQRDIALQLSIAALREPDRAHAAAADLANQPVRADLLAGPGGLTQQRLTNGTENRGGEEAALLQVRMLLQELANRVRDVGLLSSQLVQPALTLFARQIQCLIQIGCNSLPLPNLGRRKAHDTLPAIPAVSTAERASRHNPPQAGTAERFKPIYSRSASTSTPAACAMTTA
ncbi:MAG TPA: hypothetical protein VGQ22_07340 [Steroidobacteraceae bacterium]|jgi:hypothetical protein|nr:hypothetical protein [Steroidobacteraceae bacterium]